MSDSELAAFTANRRKRLFIELAAQPDGATVAEVYRRASDQGDTVTEEAYYNLARRLVHRGLLKVEPGDGVTRFRMGADSDSHWLEEEDLISMIDPEYPLLALPIWSESRRQIDDVQEDVWAELRERLCSETAPQLFAKAIQSYCDDFHAQIAELVRLGESESLELPRLKQEAENSRRLLERVVKFGLGLSDQAVHVPLSIDQAITGFRDARVKSYLDPAVLDQELARRVAPEPFVVEEFPSAPDRPFLIAAVDGSTRGGMLSFLGESGDLTVGHAPMISINTSVGQVNRAIARSGRTVPVFVRLPERPEDMQRQDNKYSIMAKLFFPDLSDSEYMHSVWNAMDLMEARAAMRVLGRWYGGDGNVEIPPADVVLRDGTVSPQDRDFRHYRGITSYEKIVRDTIDTNWRIAAKCRDDHQTIAGVVKMAQLSVLAPVINWYACQLARDRIGQIAAWPLHAMNLVPDQAIVTRLLTAKRKKSARWNRTCVVLRPFHAVTNFAQTYSRSKPPIERILEQYKEALSSSATLSREEMLFWETFRPDSDPYMKMLGGVFFGNVFVGAVPRLDIDNSLPRIEFVVPAETPETSSPPWAVANEHRDRLLAALKESQFQVSAEHQMFHDTGKIDVLPVPIIRVHDTVKLWAAELLSRVQEFLTFYLARYIKSKRGRRVKIRPFTKAELELLYVQLKQERELRAGGDQGPQLED
jgi:hypothetical protein